MQFIKNYEILKRGKNRYLDVAEFHQNEINKKKQFLIKCAYKKVYILN